MRYVLKFGGSSLASPEKIKNVAQFITTIKSKKDTEIVVVVSAMGKTTNKLKRLSDKITLSPNQYSLASILSKGEEVSAFLLSMALDNLKIKNRALLPCDIAIHVAGHPNNAIITHIDTKNIENLLQKNNIVIIPGFQGVDINGNICTLGRGGSDTTASALGVALNASVKIYTDVSGFYDFDPNMFENSKQIKNLDILAATELASSGAKVMDQTSLEIAAVNNIPLKVCKSQTTDGTNVYKNTICSFKIFGVSFKNNLLFVKNTNKNNSNLQIKIKNNGFKILFHNFTNIKNQYKEIYICDNRNLISDFASNKNIFSTNCELITISGAGLLSSDKFSIFFHNLFQNYSKSILFTNFTPTTVKVAVKHKKAFEIVKKINKFCNMENNL